MSESLSVAEMLAAPSGRVSLMRVSPGAMVVLSLDHVLDPGQFEAVQRIAIEIAARLGVSEGDIFVLDGGSRLEALDRDDLARMGLARIA